MSDREIMDGKNGIVARKSYGFRDPVVKNVVDKFVQRSDVGYEKYNNTLDDERRLKMKNLQGYLNDIQEELMDAVLYIQAAREELQDLSEEALIERHRNDKYEGQTYVVQEGFSFKNESYERQSNGKGDLVNRGCKKVLPIKYTPDFVSDSFIIECKCRANESFPLRWKMFKKYVNDNLKHVTLYKPQNQKECDKVIELIKESK